jgi:hypothetical protein
VAVCLGQLFENDRSRPNFWNTFAPQEKLRINFDEKCGTSFLAIFWQTHLVALLEIHFENFILHFTSMAAGKAIKFEKKLDGLLNDDTVRIPKWYDLRNKLSRLFRDLYFRHTSWRIYNKLFKINFHKSLH